MNPVIRFFIRFLKIFFRSIFRAAVPHHQNVSSTPEQNRESHTTTESTPTETAATEPQRKHRHRRTSVTETTTRTTTISESQSSPDLIKK